MCQTPNVKKLIFYLITMQVKISKELHQQFPQYKEGILLVKGINNSVTSDHAYQYLCMIMDQFRKEHSGKKPEQIEKLIPWRITFEKAGFKVKESLPSHDALISRIIEAVDLPNINPVVNIINALQIKHALPIGAHDIDKIEGDITVGQNSNRLSFTPRNSEVSEIVQSDEIVHADEKDVLTRRWCWRQGQKDLTDNESSNVIFFINSLTHTDEDIKKIAEELIAALAKFSSFESASFEILSKDSSDLDINKMKKLQSEITINIQTKEINRDREIIDRILDKAVEEILPSRDALEQMLLSGRRIKVYQGFDPTADTLHIGHTVMMRKLEDFRKLGHEVFFLIGDFTARIGDPTDKTSARQTLTPEQVKANLNLYTDQARAIIDLDNKENPVHVVFNNDWLGQMKFQDVIELASNFTVQQMLKRSMFQTRLEEDRPIYVHEFMYPMMQGWDSVNMEVDVELGGNDQLFNMLAGRELVISKLRKEKIVIAGRLLTTPDGKKMGKSEGNMIKLSDSANDIFGKVMAFPDEHIIPGFELLTSATLDEVTQLGNLMKSEEINPIDLKKQLALRLTKELKGDREAQDAERFFEEVFQKQEFNVEIPEIIAKDKEVGILELLCAVTGFTSSNSEARRLIEQGAVYIDSEKAKDWQSRIDLDHDIILKVGKKVVKIRKSE